MDFFRVINGTGTLELFSEPASVNSINVQAGTLEVNGGLRPATLTVTGSATVASGGVLLAYIGGTINAGSFDNSGAVEVIHGPGALNVTGTFINEAGATLAGFANNGQIQLGALVNNGASGSTTGVIFAAGTSFTVSGNTINNSYGTLYFEGGTLSSGGSVSNELGGTIEGSGAMTGAGSLTNNGWVRAYGGTLDFSGINVTNLAGGTLTGGAWTTETGGTLKLPGDITAINSASVRISGTVLDAAGNNALAGLNSINNSGSLAVYAALSTSGDLAVSNGSGISTVYNGSLTANGNVTSSNHSYVNATGGSAFGLGSGTITINGNLSNAGTKDFDVIGPLAANLFEL